VKVRCFETEPATRTAVTRSSRRSGMSCSVVDGEWRRLERGRGNTGRLVLQIDADVGEPLQVAAVHAPDDTLSSSSLVLEQHEAGELDARDLFRVFEQSCGNRNDIVTPADRIGCRSYRLPLVLPAKALRPTRGPESQNGGQDQERRDRQGEPGAAGRRFALDRQHHPVDGSHEPEGWKDREQCGLEASASPLSPDPGTEPRSGCEEGRSRDEKRHRAEPQNLFCL
jgi:hypothetical protein